MLKNFKVLLIVSMLLFAFSFIFAGDQDFTLVNETGVDIYGVYVSPSGNDEWGDDIMEEDVLEDGQSVEITFTTEESAQYWDLMVEDYEGNTITWTDIDLLTISKLILSLDGDKPTATWE